MRQLSVTVSVLVVTGACLAPARAQGGGAVYKTPEEVFNAAKKTAEKDDVKGFCDCLTEDTRDMVAVAMLITPARKLSTLTRSVSEGDPR